MTDYSAEANQLVNQIVIAIANWSTAVAVASVQWLLAAFGQSSEPDLTVIVPVYDRMLAIAVLLVGAVIALALIERIAWGSLGTGIALIPRVVAACFFAYSGLGALKYMAGYAALLATTWTPDFTAMSKLLVHSVGVSNAVVAQGTSGPHVSTFGLILTALTMSSLTVILHLELVVRSALILSVTAFVPLVSVLAIWPRAIGAATALAEFLVGLLLSKFVLATVVYVGFRLVVVALISPTDTDATENWMASGVAVLLIAAFSPVVIFSALRFAHGSAGSIARGWAGTAVSIAPAGRLLGSARNAIRPLTRPIGQHINSKITARLNRFRPRP
jgi:hypothetical protein